MDPWEGGTGRRPGECPSFSVLTQQQAERDLIVDLGLGQAQSCLHTEDPLQLPHGVRGVYSAFSALPCPTGLLLSNQALSIHQPSGGLTFLLNEIMLCSETLWVLKQIKLQVTVDPVAGSSRRVQP